MDSMFLYMACPLATTRKPMDDLIHGGVGFVREREGWVYVRGYRSLLARLSSEIIHISNSYTECHQTYLDMN